MIQSTVYSSTPTTNNLTYQYRSNDGYPLSLTYTIHTLIFSTINITTTFQYGEPFMDE